MDISHFILVLDISQFWLEPLAVDIEDCLYIFSITNQSFFLVHLTFALILGGTKLLRSSGLSRSGHRRCQAGSRELAGHDGHLPPLPGVSRQGVRSDLQVRTVRQSLPYSGHVKQSQGTSSQGKIFFKLPTCISTTVLGLWIGWIAQILFNYVSFVRVLFVTWLSFVSYF